MNQPSLLPAFEQREEIPALPRISLTMCKERRRQSAQFLAQFLRYLRAIAPYQDSAAHLATKSLREDFTDFPVTDKDYALECISACTSFLTNAQVHQVQADLGDCTPIILSNAADPFEVTEDGKAQFIRPFSLAPLFGVGWGPRQTFEQVRPLRFVAFENPMTRDVLEYWGPELRQEDLSVLLWLVKLNEGMRPGSRIHFDGKEVLAALGRSIHPNSLRALFEVQIPALERAHIALFNAETGRRRSYRLISRTELPFNLMPDGSRTYSLKNSKGWFELDSDYRTLLGLHDELNQLYLIDMKVRHSLHSKPMALWLHMYLSAQFASITLRKEGEFVRDVGTLYKHCYSQSRGDTPPTPADMKEFRKQLKKAAEDVCKAGGLGSFHLKANKSAWIAPAKASVQT